VSDKLLHYWNLPTRLLASDGENRIDQGDQEKQASVQLDGA
jgi:hypothetical protein